jgi:hypothetical protein
MTRPTGRPQRVRTPHVEWVRQRLGGRDAAVVATVGLLRLVSSMQLERLHFADLPLSHRARTRRRVVKRLIDWRVLMPLERRIGGVRAGSAGLVVCLDSAGLALANAAARTRADELAVRRPTQPSVRLLTHTLGIAELYVQLREAERAGLLHLVSFTTEPACWSPNGVGGWLKPDAHLVVETTEVADHWWYEHDEATESLPTIHRKLMAYLDFVRRGQLGPHGIVPRVLVSAPSEARCDAIRGGIAQLPEPASKLLRATTHDRALPFIIQVLRE